jgi:hypothetical protein
MRRDSTTLAVFPLIPRQKREVNPPGVGRDPYTAPAYETRRGIDCVFHCCYSVGRHRGIAHWPLRSHCEESAGPGSLTQHLPTRQRQRSGEESPGTCALTVRHVSRESRYLEKNYDWTDCMRQQPSSNPLRWSSRPQDSKLAVATQPQALSEQVVRAKPGNECPASQNRALFLLASSGFLRCAEGNSSPHCLLLNRSGRTAELFRDGARRGSRLGELFQCTQFTGAPACTIIRRTLCH